MNKKGAELSMNVIIISILIILVLLISAFFFLGGIEKVFKEIHGDAFNPDEDVCLETCREHWDNTWDNLENYDAQRWEKICNKKDVNVDETCLFWRPKTECELSLEGWIEAEKHTMVNDTTYKTEIICRELTSDELYCKNNLNDDERCECVEEESYWWTQRKDFNKKEEELREYIEMYPKCEFLPYCKEVYNPNLNKNVEKCEWEGWDLGRLKEQPCWDLRRLENTNNTIYDLREISLIEEGRLNDGTFTAITKIYKFKDCKEAIPK